MNDLNKLFLVTIVSAILIAVVVVIGANKYESYVAYEHCMHQDKISQYGRVFTQVTPFTWSCDLPFIKK